MEKIAVVFSGMGYGKDKPLLYYAAKQAKESGYEVLVADYGNFEKRPCNTADEKKVVAQSMLNSVLKQFENMDWSGKELVFISKSIGTVIACLFAKINNISPIMIMLTPLEETFGMFVNGENYLFSGDKDPYLNCLKRKDEQNEKVSEFVVYPNANHSLECGNIQTDLDVLKDCISRIGEILGRAE